MKGIVSICGPELNERRTKQKKTKMQVFWLVSDLSP